MSARALTVRQNSQNAELAQIASFKAYSGTPPADCDTALSGNTLLATFTSPVFGATNSSGIATLSSCNPELSAPAGAVPTFLRGFAVDGTTCLYQWKVSTGEVTFTPTTIGVGALVQITSLTQTTPVGS